MLVSWRHGGCCCTEACNTRTCGIDCPTSVLWSLTGYDVTCTPAGKFQTSCSGTLVCDSDCSSNPVTDTMKWYFDGSETCTSCDCNCSGAGEQNDGFIVDRECIFGSSPIRCWTIDAFGCTASPAHWTFGFEVCCGTGSTCECPNFCHWGKTAGLTGCPLGTYESCAVCAHVGFLYTETSRGTIVIT